ncbi:helix-turn-helix domain-containing protein [Fundidesulfovibrio soli]|uniref:helix-turn-helix domain-containing protein n=1 Tax=Fundidesulfovibrio soli TaxID=2922716 RepID=UPI001FAEC875|nr:helix-turn-helix transcriptional regulator [Fundidesulfovibrio soli]
MNNLHATATNDKTAGSMIRFWRAIRKVSQLDLALDAGVSARHLSFIETGKSNPSRAIILKIAGVLKMPHRHLNSLLAASGHASEYGDKPVEEKNMAMVLHALRRMLDKHDPYPAFVVNATYDILMTNHGYNRLVSLLVGDHTMRKYKNIYRLTFSSDGLCRHIKNWNVVRDFMLDRLHGEALSTHNTALFSLYEELAEGQKEMKDCLRAVDSELPILSIIFEQNDLRASFFTMLTTLGTPLDATTQELRIESLFPADEPTKELFSGYGAS